MHSFGALCFDAVLSHNFFVDAGDIFILNFHECVRALEHSYDGQEVP